jgi:hypothetical protein
MMKPPKNNLNLMNLMLHQLSLVFCNNSQDSRKYANSAEIGSILCAPNQVGTSGVATSASPSRSAYAYSVPSFKLNSSSTQDPP